MLVQKSHALHALHLFQKEAMLQIQETIDQYHYYPFLVSCLKNMFGTSWLNILKNTVPFPYNNGALLLASLQLGYYWLQPTIGLAYWIKDMTFVLCFSTTARLLIWYLTAYYCKNLEAVMLTNTFSDGLHIILVTAHSMFVLMVPPPTPFLYHLGSSGVRIRPLAVHYLY